MLYPAADRALGYAELRGRLGDSISVGLSVVRLYGSLPHGDKETNRIGAIRPLEAMLVALCYAT